MNTKIKYSLIIFEMILLFSFVANVLIWFITKDCLESLFLSPIESYFFLVSLYSIIVIADLLAGEKYFSEV